MSSLWQAFDEADIGARKADAGRIQVVSELLDTYPPASLAGMISSRSQVSTSTARAWIREAVDLRDRPDLAEAYGSGSVSQDQVAALRVLSGPGEDGLWVEAVSSELGAQDFTIVRLQYLARREVARKLERSDGGCYLKMAATPDERFVEGRFRVLPEGAAALEAQLDARVPKDTPWHLLAAAHAAALMSLVADAQGRGVNGAGAGAGLKAMVVVRSDTAVLDGISDAPGELPNGDFVPAGVVRDLAGAGRLLVLDLEGVDLDTDEIPVAVRRWVWYRDQGRCRRTDCTTPTLGLQIHHLTREGPEGRHHPRYLALLCWHCHQVTIHRLRWRLIGDAEATLTWLRPDGTIHTPPPLTKHARAPDTTS